MPATEREPQGWIDVVLSTQKRARSAFFLSLIASSIVLITVFNLWFSLESALPALNGTEDLGIQEAMKERIKHQVDRSYYELPLLGIEVTCDDAALFGPLVLLVFSFYSLIAFRTWHRQVMCLNRPPHRLQNGEFIMELLDVELFPWVSHPGDDRVYFVQLLA